MIQDTHTHQGIFVFFRSKITISLIFKVCSVFFYSLRKLSVYRDWAVKIKEKAKERKESAKRDKCIYLVINKTAG